MVLFENSWELTKDRSCYTNSHAAHTAFQLFVAAFNDKHFAEVLLNHANAVREYAKSKNIQFNRDSVEGVFFEPLESFLKQESYLSSLLRNTNEAFFSDALEIIKAQDANTWLCNESLLRDIVEVVYTLAHLENMVLLNDGSTDKSLARLNGESYTTLAEDLNKAMSLASMCVDKEFAPNGINMHQEISDSAAYLADYAMRGLLTPERNSMMMTLINMMTCIAVDFTHGQTTGIFGKTRTVKLGYSDKADNHVAAKVDLPELLFKRLPFSTPAKGLNCLVDLDTFEGAEKDKFSAYLSHNYSERCSCEHDCCGCAVVDFYAHKLSDKWALVKHSAVPNY